MKCYMVNTYTITFSNALFNVITYFKALRLSNIVFWQKMLSEELVPETYHDTLAYNDEKL